MPNTPDMLLVVDGNNVAWAGFHALRRPMGADTPEKLVRAALLGLTQSVIGFAVRAGEPPDAAPSRPDRRVRRWPAAETARAVSALPDRT